MDTQFTQEGIERIAQITREARGDYSYRYFADLTGISYSTLRNLEGALNKSIDYPTLEKLAVYTTYTFKELLRIGMGQVTIRPDSAVIEIAEQALPLVKDLPPKEILRLIGLLAAKLAEDGES